MEAPAAGDVPRKSRRARPVSAGTERARLCRDRKKRGVKKVVRIEITAEVLEALHALGLVHKDDYAAAAQSAIGSMPSFVAIMDLYNTAAAEAYEKAKEIATNGSLSPQARAATLPPSA